MTFDQLISHCIAHHISFSLAPAGGLQLNADKDALTPELMAQLKQHKPALLAWLQARHNQQADKIATIGKAAPDAPPVLSFAQQRLWLVDQIEGGSAQYNLPSVLQLQGAVNLEALEQCLNLVIQRHHILHTGYRFDASGEAQQFLHTGWRLTLGYQDLRALPATQQAASVEACISQQARAPFDLQHDLMLRAHLVQTSSSQQDMPEYVFILVLHHIASDGWSQALLVAEIETIYSALSSDQQPQLAPLPIQYRDYACWQKQTLQGAHLQAQLAYWKQQLQQLPAQHQLPLDRPRPAQPSHRGALHRQHLAPGLQQGLNALANAQQATLFMVLHAAFASLLARYSGQNDIVIGTPIANREQWEVAPLIGFFINTLVLRSQCTPQTRFQDLIGQSRQTLLDAYEHQQTPFEALVDQLLDERVNEYHPLFQVMLILQNNVQAEPKLANCAIRSRPWHAGFSMFDLTLSVREQSDGMHLEWEYACDIFDARSIERMAAHFANLLQGIIAQADTPLQALPLLTTAEQGSLARWQGTLAQQPQQPNWLCIHQYVEQQAARQPDALALQHGSQQISYQQLNASANQLARVLQAQGLQAGDLLGLCLPRSILAIQAMLASMKCGAAYLPLDPDYPPARRSMMLREAKIQRCLVHQDSQISASDLIEASDCELIWLDQPALQQAWQQAASSNLDLPGLQPQQAAYVIFTSGSSGQPKGVVAAHRSIANRLHWMQANYPARADEVFCQKTSLGFVDHVAEVFQPLVFGQPLVIIDKDDTLDPARFAELIQSHKITRLTLVPSLLRLLSEQQALSRMHSLRLVISSGEALQLSDARAFYQALPAATLLNLYGSSEVGADVSAYQMLAPDDNPAVMQYFHATEAAEVATATADTGAVTTAAFQFKPLPSLSQDSAFRAEFTATHIPQQACGYDAYLAQLNSRVLPFGVDVSSQRFIGHMTSKLPHFIPDLNRLIAQLNQNMVKVETSNSLTLIERQVLATLHRLFFQLDGAFYDLHCQDPQHVFGVVTGGGSVANLTALWGARNRALLAAGATLAELRSAGAHAVAQRLGFSRCVVLGTRLMHYSMRKSMALMGLGEQALMTVAQDAQQKMSLPDLQQSLQQCQSENCLVIAIVGIAGATETGSIDPLPAIAAIARSHGVHFHVDAAWGGAFQLSPRYRHLLDGIEQADSITLCPHKQLYLSQGISLCLLRDTLAANCIATHANYQAQPGSYDLGQYSVEGSRPAHALLLHASLHVLAQDGYAWLLQQNMTKTRYFAQLIKSCDAFELIAEPELNILNYRYIPLALRGQGGQGGQSAQSGQRDWSLEDNQQISQAVATIQQQQFLLGLSFCSKTTLQLARWPGQALTVFRIVLANPLTSFDDLRAVLQDQLRIASELIEAPGSQTRNQLPELSGQAAQLLGQSIVPIGKPIANTTLYVLDAQLNQVPPGLPGQLYIGGAGLALGYLHQPQMTAQKFIDNPFESGQKLYQSGDWVRWRDDGNLEYLGRMDEQIKIRGMRVEPGEIEAQLQQHPMVRQAVVALKRPAGQPNAAPMLTAYLVPRHDQTVASAPPDSLDPLTPANHPDQAIQPDPLVLQAQLHTALAMCLPEHMLPALYVVVPQLPLNPNGKIDRRALPDPGLPQRSSAAPATSTTEAALCRIWQQCLGLELVGREDHFFRIGGHSLSLSKMAMQCNQHFGLNLPFKEFFMHPVLADLALLIEREQAGQAMFVQLSQTQPEGHTSLML